MKRCYEKEFDILLRNSNFDIIKSSLFIRDFSIKEITYEIDHLTQRKNILFVFEGKLHNIEKAKKQLVKKRESIFYFKLELLKQGFKEFNEIRLFGYSWHKKIIIEYDFKGKILNFWKFKDVEELLIVLDNL